jgi:LysR family transcriptional activator of nhaA
MRIKSLRQLNFHHLHYFWVVAREGHLTRAAQQLHVSQSALSSQIRELESQLGHALFLREGRALRLTEFGVLALGYADGIFSLGSELVATAKGGAGLQAQHLRVGAVATLSRNFQDNFLRPVLGMPDIRLTLESASLEELLERLRAHRRAPQPARRPRPGRRLDGDGRPRRHGRGGRRRDNLHHLPRWDVWQHKRRKPEGGH